MRGEDARICIAKARTAQAAWALHSPEERAHLLRPLRYALADRMDEIVQVISEEVGKPPMDALAGDVMVTLEQLRYYEKHAGRLLRSRRIGKPWFLYQGTRFVEISEPHGVALVFAPWNYPLQLSVVPMATALFAGNAVLLKCSEYVPRTAKLIQELSIDAGLPDGLVQVFCEPAEESHVLLDSVPDFVFFTGSSRNGRKVAQKSGEMMIPTIMELGGKDAALIFDSCNLERTANGIVYGCFSNTGQVCVGTKRVYVQKTIYNEFLRILLEKVSELRTGATIESELGAVRMEKVQQQFHEHVQDALARGAKLLTSWPPESNEVVPVVLTDVPEEAALLTEESFGPIVSVSSFQIEEDAIRMANSSPFALSASVWTGDMAQGERVSLRLQSGGCAVNDVIRNIGNPEASFGGNQRSGHGRYHGAEGLRSFSRIKTVMSSSNTRLREVHWFPFKLETYTRLRELLNLRHSSSSWKALRGILTFVFILTSGIWAGTAIFSTQRQALELIAAVQV
jgi:acyl-CoA reductase-like NAD-dependent aldehyde dehydrogenase